MLSVDARAAKILSGIYWRAGGWNVERTQPVGDDRRHAIDAGYLFDPVTMDHDELVERTVELAAGLDLQVASDAFVASLSTRWLFLRPFLSSLVVASTMPRHGFEPAGPRPPGIYDGGGSGTCAVCGERPGLQDIDRNVLNFERHKWGGVRHLKLPFVWFCLDRLHTEGGAQPDDSDIALLTAGLEALRASAPTTTVTQAESALRMLKSSKDERLSLLAILSIVGVLEHPDHPGFLHTFIPAQDRLLPDRRFLDRGYPAEWWTAANGVNPNAIRTVFRQLAH